MPSTNLLGHHVNTQLFLQVKRRYTLLASLETSFSHLFNYREYEGHQFPLRTQQGHHVVGPIFASGRIKCAEEEKKAARVEAN